MLRLQTKQFVIVTMATYCSNYRRLNRYWQIVAHWKNLWPMRYAQNAKNALSNHLIPVTMAIINALHLNKLNRNYSGTMMNETIWDWGDFSHHSRLNRCWLRVIYCDIRPKILQNRTQNIHHWSSWYRLETSVTMTIEERYKFASATSAIAQEFLDTRQASHASWLSKLENIKQKVGR